MRQHDIIVTFSYRRRDGESSLRRVKATSMAWIFQDDLYGRNLYLRAFDVDRDDYRTFAFTGITNALSIEDPPPLTAADEPEAPPF